jgi:3-phosphoshikimate 1-carboxyvinyltransferase
MVAISGAQIPDLIPILAVVAAAKHGAVFTQIRRLRLKESDRVAAIGDLLSALGIRTEGTEDTLRVYPGRFAGGTVDPRNDHRIAMAAAVAALAADGPVTIADCECVAKSYPGFWDDFKLLGGQYAFHVR